MRSLIQFIIRHHFLLLFILYVFLSFLLIFQFNNYHKSYFVNTVHTVKGNYAYKLENLGRYFSLKKENLRLIEENRNLNNQIEKFKTVLNDTLTLQHDSIVGQKYSYLAARIVNNTTNKKHNYITINKGSEQGVEVNTAVICDEGIVGIVKAVSDNYATVMSVLNLNFRLSAKLKKNNFFGAINWDGRNYQFVSFNEILHHVPVALNDTIVTSSFSNIFPEGVLVGTVEDFSLKGNFYRIKVKLSTDFRQLSNVYVVKNLYKEEVQTIQQLEND